MEENKLAALIRPLEDFAAKHPGAYKMRVALLATVGYAYLLLVVSVLLGIIVTVVFYASINFVVIKILWIPLVLVGIVLRSLWITIPVPDGMELEREQAPELFDLIHEVTTALNGPKVHHVLLSDEFNASIVQIPQFGMFGWLHNYLVVGLPLLRAFTPVQFRAVLAHEVGHLSGKHGRFSGWIYRLRQSWIEVLTNVHYDKHYASFLFEPFLNWYAPYLNAYSFVLARAQERHADEYAVELAGREVTAVMLARFPLKQRELTEHFWPKFFNESKEQPKAPRDPFERMLNGVAQPIGPATAQRWFYQALRVPTGYDDTHPALTDRLAAIGFAKDSPELESLLHAVVAAEQTKEPAATRLVPEMPEDFLPRQNRLWREQLVHKWNESHAQSNAIKKQLSEMEEQANVRPLTLDEQWLRVKLLAQMENDAATMPFLQQILTEDPEHAGANFAMGAILLEQNNADGVGHLEKAMQVRPDVTGEASTLIAGYYFEQGNKELAEKFSKRAADEFEKERKRQEQALTFTDHDKFLSHDLDEAIVKDIKTDLNKVWGLSEAYLVRKVIDGAEPVYVLAVVAAYTWKNGQNAKHLDALFADLMNVTSLPTPTIFVSLDVKPNLISKIVRVPGAAVYKRG
jgi:Zn-dependent protease with chaperone function